MNGLNLFIFNEAVDLSNIADYERELTEKDEVKQVKSEEIRTLRCLVRELEALGAKIADFDGFFYGFSIPHISKEFDLLKLFKNDKVINIELKSQMVGREAITEQLRQNQRYLGHLKMDIYSFTYALCGDKGEVYALKDDQLVESSLEEVLALVSGSGECITENLESLFNAKDYLISPVNDAESFIDGNYYLTGKQDEIKKRIMDSFKASKNYIWGITGNAGTGKTLLLYDLAKTLGREQNVVIVHSGILTSGHRELSAKLKGVEIIPVKECSEEIFQCDCVLIDEAQRLHAKDFKYIIENSINKGVHCIFAYDYFQVLSYYEERNNIPDVLKGYENFIEETLTDRIRTNREVFAFIRNIMDLNEPPRKGFTYDSVEVLFARDYEAAKVIVDYYEQQKGYKFISYSKSGEEGHDLFENYMNTHEVIGQEFDNVIFMMDDRFYYDAENRLRAKSSKEFKVDKLWYQGVSRTREKLTLLIVGNEELFKMILSIKLQNT